MLPVTQKDTKGGYHLLHGIDNTGCLSGDWSLLEVSASESVGLHLVAAFVLQRPSEQGKVRAFAGRS